MGEQTYNENGDGTFHECHFKEFRSDKNYSSLSYSNNKHDVQMSPMVTPRSRKLQKSLKRAARKREAKRRQQNQDLLVNILYGIINAVIVCPVIISFGKIIYQAGFYQPYMPTLIRLTTMSGVVHQIVFSTFSSLPFAIGQVQDAGLIFLSNIAMRIVSYCESPEIKCSSEQILATSTIGLATCTAMLGVALVAIGKFKLASIVQKLPTAVVGGYLAYIGYFCGVSGLSIMGGDDVDGSSINGLLRMVQDPHVMMLVLPGIVGGVAIFVLVKRIRHMSVLPCCIVFLLVIFYVLLSLTNTSIEESKEFGWISKSDDPPVWYHMWDFLSFENVVWGALWQTSQISTWFAMTFVVALSSSLDVAAIELELGKKLDYDHEIKTVGLSNIVSGLTGGYTGSYIFSQSIFSLRAGIRSRLTGFTVAIIEFLSIASPTPITSYVPNFFFGALLTMICVDLMIEWLWEVRHKVSSAEYFVALSTFAFIHYTNVEYGIILGVIIYTILYLLGFDVGVQYLSSATDIPSVDSLTSLASITPLESLMEVEKESKGETALNNYGAVNNVV